MIDNSTYVSLVFRKASYFNHDYKSHVGIRPYGYLKDILHNSYRVDGRKKLSSLIDIGQDILLREKLMYDFDEEISGFIIHRKGEILALSLQYQAYEEGIKLHLKDNSFTYKKDIFGADFIEERRS